ncbi:MAG: sulfotransferase domain-containing protein [Rhizomicrobium sp.]
MTAPGGIVWLASFPKSGNTWLRIFLANLRAKNAGPIDINTLFEYGSIASSRVEFEAETLLDSGLLSHDDIDSLRPCVYRTMAAQSDELRWIKVHDAYTETVEGEPLLGRNTARAAIYLVRDPRDVAISLAFHINASVDEAIELMNAPDGALCLPRDGLMPQLRQKLTGWSGHVRSWLEQTDVAVHMTRYEDLVADPFAGFGAMLRFVEISATTEEIEHAVRSAQFAELQRQESESGFRERISLAAPFFRTGGIGGWRAVLTPEQVREIERCHGAVMARLGYELQAFAARGEPDSPKGP